MASNKELEAMVEKLQEENAKLQEQLITRESVKGLSPIQADPEIITLKNELLNLKGELQLTLDNAKVAAGLNVPQTKKFGPKDIIRVPQPLSPDGKTELPPPAGAVLKKFRVILQDSATKLVELWEIPGQGFASHGTAIAAFNKFMGIIKSDYNHDVTEVTGPEVMVAPPRTTSTMDTTMQGFSGYPANINQMLNTGEIVDPALSRQREMMTAGGV